MSQNSELIARLRDLSKMLDEYEGGNFKWSEEAATARDAADALQALERVPMSNWEIDEWMPVGNLPEEDRAFVRGIKSAESFHNIMPLPTPPEKTK